MDSLEFSNISAEIRGSMISGQFKMTNEHIIFKITKTGKIKQIQQTDMELVNFQNFANFWGIRIFLKNGTLHRFTGFQDRDKKKIAKFFSRHYKLDMLEKELSVKGWNWGTANFNGSVLSFDVGDRTAFEIPLNNVSQCTSGKNEVAMEFHQNENNPVNLVEMRFFVPGNELTDNTDPVENFHQQVVSKANINSLNGDVIAIFREIHCLTPRGRYDIKIFHSIFQLHGKTFDFKIPLSSILRLFVLQHKNCRQILFVISLDPPIKQGQTRHNFLVLLFEKEEKISIELPFTEEELKEKYDNKLTKDLSGPTYEVFGKLMNVIVNQKLTESGKFIGHSGTPAISCSVRAAAGYLYPLENEFIFVHKPTIYIRFEEIYSVMFARGCSSTKSFDLEIEIKFGPTYTFSNIEKEEYRILYEFVRFKKIYITNCSKSKASNYKYDHGGSDNKAKPARVKPEAKERTANDDGLDLDSDDSTDEDFKPNAEESDVAEEYDSKYNDSDDSNSNELLNTKEKINPKKTKSTNEDFEKLKQEKEKGNIKKDISKPKRPVSAFMFWLNEMREQIKADNPGIKVTEITSKGDEMWKTLQDKSKWENKAANAKVEYNNAMKEYLESTAGAKGKKKIIKKKKSSKKSASKNTNTPEAKQNKKTNSNSIINNEKEQEKIVPMQKEEDKRSELVELESTSVEKCSELDELKSTSVEKCSELN